MKSLRNLRFASYRISGAATPLTLQPGRWRLVAVNATPADQVFVSRNVNNPVPVLNQVDWEGAIASLFVPYEFELSEVMNAFVTTTGASIALLVQVF